MDWKIWLSVEGHRVFVLLESGPRHEIERRANMLNRCRPSELARVSHYWVEPEGGMV